MSLPSVAPSLRCGGRCSLATHRYRKESTPTRGPGFSGCVKNRIGTRPDLNRGGGQVCSAASSRRHCLLASLLFCSICFYNTVKIVLDNLARLLRLVMSSFLARNCKADFCQLI